MAMTGGTPKLVKTGYANYGSAGAINLYVYYKSSQSASTNKSTVKCGMYVDSPSSSYDIGQWDDNRGSYVGTTALTFNGTMPNFAGRYWLVEDKTFTVDHDDDGKGKATIYWKWGVNSPWGQMENPSGSFTIDLPTIARASVPTLSASTVKMGNTLTINTNRKSSSFTHTIKCKFGGTTTTIATGVGASYNWTVPDWASRCNNAVSGTATITVTTYSGNTNVGSKSVNVTLSVPSASVPTFVPKIVDMGNSLSISTNRKSTNFTHTIAYSFNGATGTVGYGITTSKSWTVPLSLAKQIPSDPFGNGTITCKTYNGTALVGTTDVGFTANVPNNTTTQPTFTEEGFALAPIGNVPSAFTGLYIQGKTGVKASFTASSTYSTIASYKMVAEGKTYSGSLALSDVFYTPGSKTITGTVTDARGYSTKQEKTITVIAYAKPKIVPYSGEKSIIVTRCKQDGTISDDGMFLKIKCGRSYSKVASNGVQKNTCEISYSVVASGGNHTDDSFVKLLKTTDSSDFVNVALDGLVTSTKTSYSVQLKIKDTIGEGSTYSFVIPTSSVDFNLREGGHGAAFGKYSEIEDGVEFEWDVYGRAYGLGKLIKVPEKADMNDAKYRVFGCYAITQSDIAETISNLPVPYAGTLRVYSATGSGNTNTDPGWIYIAQEYEPYYGNGRYRRLLHRDGTDAEWAFDPWRAIGGVDGVVSEGTYTTSSDLVWHFKKWFNGTAECWARRNVDVDATTQWGSAMYYGSVSAVGLPFTFVEPPVCHIGVEKGTTASSNAFLVASSGQATTTTAPSVLLCRPTSATGINVNVLYSIHGMWK